MQGQNLGSKYVQNINGTNFYVAKQSLMRDVSEYVETEKKTNNAPDSFKMKTPGHSNLCVYVKYLYKGYKTV